MTKPWYEKPLRIAALQCNFEGGRTLDVVDKWVDMGFNAEQLFHPMADAYSALYDPALHHDLMAAYVSKAKAAGLRIIVYLNVHILGPSIAHHHESWAQRHPDGSYPMLYDTYYACCVNSPWRDYFLQALEGVAEFDIDGVFLDGPIVVQGGCYCPSCRARYRRETGRELTPDEPTWDFFRRSKDDLLNEGYARFKALKPDGVYYINLPVMHPTGSYVSIPEALQYNDIVGTEGGFMFYAPPKNAYLWKPTVAAKVLEAVAPDKGRVIFMAADQKSWSWYAHTPAETRLCIASTVANGAGIWYGLHGSTRLLSTPGAQAARETLRFLADHEPAYEGTSSAAKVAVMYSLDTERTYRKSGEVTDLYGSGGGGAQFAGNFTDAFHGWCDILCRSGIPFDVVTDLGLTAEALARYECLLLPTCACLSDGSLAAIRAWVAAGGRLIANFDASLYTPAGQRRPDLGLADVFGASIGQGAVQYREWNYITLAEQPSAAAQPLLAGLSLPYYPAPGYALDVTPYAGAEVLGQFLAPMSGRYVPLTAPERPALIWHRYGAGQSLLLAGTFAEMALAYVPPEYTRLLANAVGAFAPSNVRLGGGMGNIEVVARRQGERLVVHLVNYAAPIPRPIERVFPQSGLTLRIPGGARYRAAEALVARSSCPIRVEGPDLVVDLPELGEYEVVAVA